MKANFALILDQDGIVLLNRAKVTWRVVGQAHPASERLVEEMAYLRRTAMELSGGRFSTKLVIPNSQILYTALQIDPAREDRKNAIREALEGLTPYAVDELTFDWTDQDDGSVTVAAVADITLSEAEAFADEHRFNPLSFVAIPEALDFPKEPFFGATAKSRDLLNPGGVVEQDIEPIDIVAVLADLDKATAAATASDSMVATGADAPVPLVARAQEDEVPEPEAEQAEAPELEPVEEAAVEDDVVEAVAGADAEERAAQDAEPETNEDVSELIRPIALTRKNALFAGHDEGGRTWGRIASLIATAKINGVEPFAYLKATLEAIAAGHPASQIDELLPWNFKPSS